MRPQYTATILGHRLNTGGIKSLNISIIISAILISLFVISMLYLYPILVKTGLEANVNMAATNASNTNVNSSNSSFTCDIPILKLRTEIVNPSKMEGLDGYTIVYLGHSQYSQYILCAISDFLVASGNNILLWLNQTGNILAHILFIDGYWLSDDQNLINSIGYIREHLLNGRAVIIMDHYKVNGTLLINGLRDLLDDISIKALYNETVLKSGYYPDFEDLATGGIVIYLVNLNLPNSPPVQTCIELMQRYPPYQTPFKSNTASTIRYGDEKNVLGYYNTVSALLGYIFRVKCQVGGWEI
jgi:hypothetical protein